jgi:pyruvate dehydrogenase E1 component beta subunit
MSGGQFNVPVVIRMATGAGRQLAAQHSHSLEAWYAHVPGLKVAAPATVDDARWMLGTALGDPDPVVIFEHVGLYNLAGTVEASGSVPLQGAAVRRPGTDLSIVTYGGSLPKSLQAAEMLEAEGISAEVVDLRMLRPLDTEAILASVARTHRLLVVDEGWKSVSLSAEIVSRVTEEALWELDAPPARVASVEVPVPYARHMELAALPQPERIVATAHWIVGR